MGFAATLRLRAVRVCLLVILFVILASILVSQKLPPRPSAAWLFDSYGPKSSQELDGSDDSKNTLCREFPDPGTIAIAVKTGATEAVEKIPMLMSTTLQCAQHVKIFSDLEQDIAGYKIHDALADIPQSAMEGNSDFDYYWKLKEAQRYGQIEKMLRGHHDPRITTDLASWTLDKYKQLHILEKLYAEYPDKDWYMMVDADTYIVWSNLLRWLKQLPQPTTEKLYLGSSAKAAGVKFAHGGSGILLSQATMHELAVVNKGTAASWDRRMHNECCGDLVIGRVLKEMGILLKPSWPTINGEKPLTLPFGPTHWCQPLVTMHHAQPNEMNQLQHFELSRNNTKEPLTLAELFQGFVRATLPGSLDHWDNKCHDIIVEIDSYEACHMSCVQDKDCFQFTHHGNQCARGHSIHLGISRESKNATLFRSGWLLDRIYGWADSQAPCDPKFPWTG
jgi:hypothetical protein